MSNIINEIDEFVKLQKNLIAKIGNEKLAITVKNGIQELLELKEKLDSIFIDYTFYLKQDIPIDFYHISLAISNIEISGIGESVMQFILNYDLKHSFLYWIDTMTDGLKLQYKIKTNHNGDSE
jgi:hypothetical protein